MVKVLYNIYIYIYYTILYTIFIFDGLDPVVCSKHDQIDLLRFKILNGLKIKSGDKRRVLLWACIRCHR